MDRIHKKILVTGMPRSGTRTVAHLLSRAGVVVQHENEGEDGIVSSYFGMNVDLYEGRHLRPRRDYEFEHVWHLMRHPLNVIASMMSPSAKSWRWFYEAVGIETRHGFSDLADLWIRWNRQIECDFPQARRVKIERLESQWPLLMADFGIENAYEAVNIGNHRAARRPVTWGELGSMEEATRLLAKEYGYHE